MTTVEEISRLLRGDGCAAAFETLYGPGEARAQAGRYERVAERFSALFGQPDSLRFFSAPGRAEIGGNHTDHQLGRVLTAGIHLDTVAAAAANGGTLARIDSEGFPPIQVDLRDLAARKEEQGRAESLVRGCAARMAALGRPVGGFDAAVTSAVLRGSGLSSSAAFEVLLLAILDGLFGRGDMDPTLRAKAAQYAENRYFGKPSGLLDQISSSVGGLITVDFLGEEPRVEGIPFDFSAHGLTLAVVNTGGSHDDLTHAYAAIPREMGQVAALFGEEHLRLVDPAAFEERLPTLRGRVSDRALLRALHFFGEDARVPAQAEALRKGEIARFLEMAVEAGESSWKLLQNVWAAPEEQPLSLALELSRRMLAGRGAWRVQGGGFAGTILAFVPVDLMPAYRERMERAFGAGACQPLLIRPVGAYELPMGKGKTTC